MAGEVWRYEYVHDEPDEGAENENRRLKRMFADLSMQADLLKEALGKCMVRPAFARLSCVAVRLA